MDGNKKEMLKAIAAETVYKCIIKASMAVILILSAFMLASLFACSTSHTITMRHKVEVDKPIHVYTHDLPEDMQRAVRWAVNEVNDEVFSAEGCSKLVVVEEAKTFVDGLHFFDDVTVTTPKYSCGRPFIWAYRRDGRMRWAGSNFCETRIDSLSWRHPLDPNMYMAANHLLRMLGLPQSGSGPFTASYTANDGNLRRGRSIWEAQSDYNRPVLFMLMDGEKKLLRHAYCSTDK